MTTNKKSTVISIVDHIYPLDKTFCPSEIQITSTSLLILETHRFQTEKYD
jgi:hypothetical protein